MIEQLTPSYQFVCDRCGKKQPIKGDVIMEKHDVFFTHHQILKEKTVAKGEICQGCLKDFYELAESFFSDLNNTEKGGEE